jgi:hypothetical protein
MVNLEMGLTGTDINLRKNPPPIGFENNRYSIARTSEMNAPG